MKYSHVRAPFNAFTIITPYICKLCTQRVDNHCYQTIESGIKLLSLFYAAFKILKLQMESVSRMLLVLCLVSLCLLPSLMANPMQAALDSVHCVRRGYTFAVKVVGCQERKVTVNTCLGTCLSFSTPTGPKYEQVESCTCCQPIKTEKIDVGLWCQDKSDPDKLVKYYHKVESVTECACASC